MLDHTLFWSYMPPAESLPVPLFVVSGVEVQCHTVHIGTDICESGGDVPGICDLQITDVLGGGATP